MKVLIIMILMSFAFSTTQAKVVYETVEEYGVIKTRKKQLDGVGFNLSARVKITETKDEATGAIERKVTVSFASCKNIEINDAKAKELREGEYIRFRLSNPNSCLMGSWERFN